MITDERRIRAFVPKNAPIKIAAQCYRNWHSDIEFIDDLDDYLLTGFVVSRPDLFFMLKVIDIAPPGSPPEPAWFVRICVGGLLPLLGMMPQFLPKICFCRRNDGRMRIYSTERLMHWALRLYKEN